MSWVWISIIAQMNNAWFWLATTSRLGGTFWNGAPDLPLASKDRVADAQTAIWKEEEEEEERRTAMLGLGL